MLSGNFLTTTLALRQEFIMLFENGNQVSGTGIVRNISSIEEITYKGRDLKTACVHFLRGAVDKWIRVNGNQWFHARDLIKFVYGSSSDWNGIILQKIYKQNMKIYSNNHDVAHAQSGRVVGHLLKEMLFDDQIREFDITDGGMARKYCIRP